MKLEKLPQKQEFQVPVIKVSQQIVRIDRQTKTPLSPQTEAKVIDNIKKSIKDFDGVILSDYHLGCLTDNVVKCAIEEAKKHNKIIVADIQKNMEKYKGATAITPNQPDSEKQVGYFIKDEETLVSAGEKLLKELDLEKVLLTRGENGMALFEKNNDKIVFNKVPAFNKKEVFTTGTPISILKSTTTSEIDTHTHDFIELVYIKSGSGYHKIDDMEFEVKKAHNTIQITNPYAVDYGDIITKVPYVPVVTFGGKGIAEVIDGHIELGAVAMEFVFSKVTPEVLEQMERVRAAGVKVCVGSMWPSADGGYDDDRAVEEGADKIWGWIVRNGGSQIMTDRPFELMDYLRQSGRHR